MGERENFYPTEENLGKSCLFWSKELGCTLPKIEMEGRRSCEGIIDDICLYLKGRRPPKSLTDEQLMELKLRIPDTPLDIPPGDIEVEETIRPENSFNQGLK